MTDLERIADLAVNLAGYSLSAGDNEDQENLLDVGTTAIELVEDAVEAFEAGDADACFDVDGRDDELDGLCERLAELTIRDLLERHPATAAFESLLPTAYRLLLTMRDLERVGDHAVNIAARTLYMVESNDALV